jgi:hypothetical protein
MFRAAAGVVAWLRAGLSGSSHGSRTRGDQLLVAFLAMVALLIVLGVAELRVLSKPTIAPRT